ncbi:hypothetical protein A2U01_0014208 [Trifolium medium]|uniref:Uncharacterized protein n=1 Tax=Trifolium medium TaxID=97028 RepID=A0A392N0D2_9FABA|nr:hypothetical protein [Trifolium medium]
MECIWSSPTSLLEVVNWPNDTGMKYMTEMKNLLNSYSRHHQLSASINHVASTVATPTIFEFFTPLVGVIPVNPVASTVATPTSDSKDLRSNLLNLRSYCVLTT